MNAKVRTAVNPTRAEDYPGWYQEVIKVAELAENSMVRGCMVIKPWGYGLWENIQQALDKMIKETGHQNFYFPMFVPLSYLAKEAEHVEGFAKECAVVTHHRLEASAEKGLVPAAPLEEPLVIRPTSEAIIGEAYSRWIQSYRDLPLLGNQWANVVRWEMRPRIFLRTSEFLWQEGHTAHATSQEAIEEAEKMLEVYRILVEDFLAIPVMLGIKTENEKFPGADITYCMEAMMQDGKALQAGTSHFLGQNFAKAFNIKYSSAEGNEEFVWTTSWGVSTRLIGGLIMTHSDDDGLVLPPRIAPLQVVIVPVCHQSANEEEILAYCDSIKAALKAQSYYGRAIQVEIDRSEKRSGDKVWGWIKKGVPIRLEVGQKELEAQSVYMARRDLPHNEKRLVNKAEFIQTVPELLEEIQQRLFNKAKKYQEMRCYEAKDEQAFYEHFSESKSEPGFVLAYWVGDNETEERLKQDLKVTARCIPLDSLDRKGVCVFTGSGEGRLTVFARAY